MQEITSLETNAETREILEREENSHEIPPLHESIKLFPRTSIISWTKMCTDDGVEVQECPWEFF